MRRFLAALQIVVLACPSIASLEALAKTREEIRFDGSSFTETVELSDVVSHTRYEDREVDSTCYRDEIQGYRTECETHDRQECTPITRTECRDITRSECWPTTRRECNTENERVCTPTTRRECSAPRQVCTPITRRECSSQQKCEDVTSEVCGPGPGGTRVCRPITRRQCTSEPVCRDVSDQVCRSEGDGQCHDVPDQVCRDIPHESCRNVPDQECRQVPDRVCREVDDQVCRTWPETTCRDVPNVVQVPYDCKKTISVPVEEVIDKEIDAQATVNFSMVPEGVKAQEKLLVTLDEEDLELRTVDTTGDLLLLAEAQDAKKERDGKKVRVSREFNVNLISKADLEKSLQGAVTSAVFEKEGLLRIRVQSLQFPNLLDFALSLDRVRFFIHNLFTKKVFNGELPSGADAVLELQPTPQPGEADLVVDLSKLALKEKLNLKKKYKVGLMTQVKESALAKVLNKDDLPAKLKSKRVIETK